MKVLLEDEGTIIGDFQKKRTDAISEMFGNVDEYGIYPTTKFFARIDAAAKKVAERARKEPE